MRIETSLPDNSNIPNKTKHRNNKNKANNKATNQQNNHKQFQ